MCNKAIYQPSGKAGEYAAWACNLYTGCSNNCDYCYCKRGPLGHLWTLEPRLKKCFKNENDAYDTFVCEIGCNNDELRRKGLFFSFTTDPMLPRSRNLTIACITIAVESDIPVTVLTKMADFVDDFIELFPEGEYRDHVIVGFTLTGHDEMESHAAANVMRVEAMRRLHDAGFKTFASLEPVIDVRTTLDMFTLIRDYNCCDHVKVGLQSGRKTPYNPKDIKMLYDTIKQSPIPIYFKHSVTDFLGIPHETQKYPGAWQ